MLFMSLSHMTPEGGRTAANFLTKTALVLNPQVDGLGMIFQMVLASEHLVAQGAMDFPRAVNVGFIAKQGFPVI